jgi:hypothetical protein
MEDTWTNRDLPVLRAVVEIHDTTGKTKIGVGEIANAAGFDVETTRRAIRALYTEPYLQEGGMDFGGNQIFVGPPTGPARRVAGAWPSPEGLVDQLVAALEAAAEDESRPEPERSKFKQLALGLGGTAYQLAISVVGNAGGNILSS